MSYPDARYLGVTGEISAMYRSADQKAELTLDSGTAIGYLSTGAFTNDLARRGRAHTST